MRHHRIIDTVLLVAEKSRYTREPRRSLTWIYATIQRADQEEGVLD